MRDDKQLVADFLTLLSRCDDAELAYQLFQRHAAMLGFEHSLYAYFFPADDPDNSLYLTLDNYPDTFFESYYASDSRSLAPDITVDWCAQRNSPLLWEGVLYNKLLEESPEYQQQNRLSHDFGVKYGMTLPFDTGSQLSQCGIGLSATHINAREFKADILPNLDLAQALCHYLDSFIRSLPAHTRLQTTQNDIQSLNAVEQQTLQWLATGHSVREIADEKLHRSVSRVNHHINMLKSKLGAANRPQMIARAVLLGLADPI